ncbi:MAG TPA: TIGR01906 family membrane protein [Anaerolineaceae bacterium]|nr:TIGR01906 family membrane protein [Anaerolineaceae bacterium]HPN53956.1 TIGR01906 family membrane protein [Anaerolineaceae bacterium]
MKNPSPLIKKICSVLITILVPLALMMTAIRLLITPLYPQIEYRMPGFPADSYGFTLEDRLKWSKISIDYLVNNEDISWLANQKLDANTPLYAERELSHMLDVKNLVQAMLVAWFIVLLALIVMGFWAWRAAWLDEYFRALRRGGWLTMGLIAAILIGVAVSFYQLFTVFHQIFFTGDTWLFLWSDTLIRLFPLRFWQDAFIAVGIFSVLGALGLAFLLPRPKKA